jgi:surfeit locus 1 family protein
MRFRPYPVLTILCLPALGLLLWLGAWQLQRAQWKEGLVADFERQAAAAPLQFGEALCAPGDPIGRTVSAAEAVRSVDLAAKAIRMFGPSASGAVGWRTLQPAAQPPCATGKPILIQTGFEAVTEAAPEKPFERYVLTAWPPHGMMEAENDPAGNAWHWFDAPQMARALGVPAIEDRFYLAPFTGQLPDALERVPPAQHYGYAATWFGMALGLIAIYAAFHARAGRLRFRPARSENGGKP